MATTARTTRGGRGVAEADVPRPQRTPRREPRWPRMVSLAVLLLGGIAFLFPFYYMIVGSLQ
jgi:multiple sugar transport system permease protein